jgi:hypothetical protein
MTSFTTYEEYYDYYVPAIDSFPQRDDFMKVLEWAADKPGEVLALSDLGRIFDPESEPEKVISRVISVAIILTTWPEQIAESIFKIKSANGKFYDVGLQEQDIYDGKKSFVLDATGETIEDFGASAYVYIRFKDYEPKLAVTAPTNTSPKL